MSNQGVISCLDLDTCSQCLMLHCQITPGNDPIHEGCRCVRFPIQGDRPWKFPDSEHATMFGPLEGQSVHFYRAYLLERAMLREGGLRGVPLSQELWKALEHIQENFPNVPVGLQAGIAGLALWEDPSPQLEIALDIMRCVNWPGGNLRPVYHVLVKHGRYADLEVGLARLVQEIVNQGEYIKRHRGMVYRHAAQVTKKVSKDKTAEYLEQAAKFDTDNTAILVELGGVLRQLGRTEEAYKVIAHALNLYPNLKGAQKELAKLQTSKGTHNFSVGGRS